MMRAVWRVMLGGRRGGDEDDCGICDAGAATKAAAVAWLLARSFWSNSLTSLFASYCSLSLLSSSVINIYLLIFSSSLKSSKVCWTLSSRLLSSSPTLARSPFIRFNSNKTKRNWKLEAKFFGPFRMLHPVRKQAYKLELAKRWRIHDVFHMSLLEQDTTKKGRVDKMTSKLEFKGNGNGHGSEYKVKAIWDSAVYTKESEGGHLLGFYFLVL